MYSKFIGVDIGKFEFVVAVYGSKKTEVFANDVSGINAFTAAYKSQLAEGFLVLENTGGYEKLLLETLCTQSIAVHRADTRKAKNFIKSEGIYGKTDRIDAIALSRYASERHGRLPLYQLENIENEDLKKLVLRRVEMKKMLVAEKNRQQAPKIAPSETASITRTLDFLNAEIECLESTIQMLLSQKEENVVLQKILKSIPGVGPQTTSAFITLLPELGRINRRQIASLVGIAPHPCESGVYKGHRSIKGGRTEVRRFLFMAGMAASHSQSCFKVFYEQLVARGKKKIVAVTPVMRKVLLVANALLKQYYSTGEICLFKK